MKSSIFYLLYAKGVFRHLFCILILLVAVIFSISFSPPVQAIAKQSTLTISTSTHNLAITISPSSTGAYSKSGNNTISIETDNFTGYTLMVATDDSTSLVNQDDDEIESISAAVDETTFSAGSSYKNKWGFMPSQYITTSGGVDTVVQNSNFLPAPSTSGDLLAKSSAANSTADTYTIAFGAKIGFETPPGSYSYTYNLIAIANAVVYNVTYDANTQETVTNMPSPNPQALSVDGGTPAAQSYGTLSNAVPTITSASLIFGGWCDVTTTVDSTTGNYLCSGTVYDASDQYAIDQTAGANITLYAIWNVDPFPTVWSHMGACEFHGATNGYITGTECQDHLTDKFIDTGVALYSTTNYSKDYEIHFTIDHYVPSEQDPNESQQTFVSDKLSTGASGDPYKSKAPGVIVRRSGNNIEVKHTYGQGSDSQNSSSIFFTSNTSPATTDVSIFRINNTIYARIDHGPLLTIQTLNNFSQQFGLNTWFGAYPDDGCTGNETNGVCTNAKRYIEATFSNMYIKLGDFDEANWHEVQFNAEGGNPYNTVVKVIDGDSIGEAPVVTKTDYVFNGWFTERNGGGVAVLPSRVPTTDEIYWAYWLKSVSLAQISNSNLQLAINTTDTINVTNSSELEGYSFTSNDTSVATVNPTTGLVTAVGLGTTTITMTGAESGNTYTINVTVASSLVDVTFIAGQGSSVAPMRIGIGTTISDIPVSILHGYTFEGWYTGQNGTGTKLTTSLAINENTIFYANWVEMTYVCKIATELHEETCSRTTSDGCRKSNIYAYNATIQYGTIPNSTTLSPGFAYTCDINADNYFDEEDERFYYLRTNNDNAVLVYYRNIVNVTEHYDPAIADLPDSSTWRNTYLVAQDNSKVARFMTQSEVYTACGGSASGLSNHTCEYLMEKSNFANTDQQDGIWLIKVNDSNTGGRRIHTTGLGVGNVNPSSTGSNNAPRPVIEVPLSLIEEYSPPVLYYDITFDARNGDNTSTIHVPIGDAIGAQMPQNPVYTDYIFVRWYDAYTGNTVTSLTEPSGAMTVYAEWIGTVALANITNTSITLLEGNTATVAVTNSADIEPYTFSSLDPTIATVNSSTGLITAVATGTTSIRMTGTTSSDYRDITVNVLASGSTYEVTFDPQNGGSSTTVYVISGQVINSQIPQQPTYAGHAFVRWYDVATGNTVDYNTEPTGDMTVYAEWKLDVQQAIISNNDLTLMEGGQITILVSNSSSLEPYTFSSNDTSIATVNSSTGVITGVGAGTTSVRVTGTLSNLYIDLEVTVTAAPATMYGVTFNANGGASTQNYRQVEDGTAVGALPTATRTNYRFFGWYTDDGTFYTEVTPETVVNGDVTYYAKWVEDTTAFPIVWAEPNACTFGSGNVSGTYCDANNKTKTYIDTAVQLFTQANYNKDFEVGFTIVEYTPANNANQATFVNSKQENSSNNYPGFVFRRWSNDASIVELTQKWLDNDGSTERFTAATTKSVKISRITANNQTHIYYSINGGTPVDFQNITNITTLYFDTKVWFGASVQSNGTSSWRPLTGTLTDMYIRLGTDSDYTIDFDANGGTANPTSITVTMGDQIGQLPTVTPPNSNYTFVAWYDESVSPAVAIDSTTRPDSNKTYVAHWNYTSSDTPVTFDVSNNATRGYQTIIDTWAQSPISITTFNKVSPINNSTWGDTSELNEAGFWTGLKSNFETNECLIPTYADVAYGGNATVSVNQTKWASGSVDCSKPDAYDTLIGAALDVYLYDLSNSTLGAQVAYAKADDGVIHNMIPGQTYKWVKSDDSTIYGYVTATSSNGRRWVDTGKIRNARDLGGLPVTYTNSNNETITGTVAYGRLFRGERLWDESATELTNLGINKEYDLSDGTELSGDTKLSQYTNDQVIHYNFETYDSSSSSNYMRAWNAVTDIMTDIVTNNKNIYFHCRVGADRTGTIAYILEGLLGVPDEDRYEEYSLTYLSGLYDRTRYYKQKSSNNALKFVFMMDYLQTTQDIYDWYMANPNASASLIQQFRSAMVNIASVTPASSPNNAPASSPELSYDNYSTNETEVEEIEQPSATNSFVLPLGVTSISNDSTEDSVDVDSPSDDNFAMVAGLTAAASASTLAYVAVRKRLD